MTQPYISFPYLDLKFNIDEVAFSVFGKDIYWYGIIIAFGFLLAVICAMFLASKYGMSKDTVLDVVLFAAPVAVVCARAYYVIFEWDYYGKHLDEIIQIWNGGIAIYGAIIGAVAVAIIYCRIKKENTALFCDIGCIGLLIGQSIGRWGNFVNQEAFGGNTNLPWAMTGNEIKRELYSLLADGVKVDPDMPVHPTFLYESLWNGAFAIIFLLTFKKRKFDGQIFLFYLMSYGTGRFFIEWLRTDSLMLGSLKISQLVAMVCVAVSAVLMIINLKNPNKKLTTPIAQKSQENS